MTGINRHFVNISYCHRTIDIPPSLNPNAYPTYQLHYLMFNSFDPKSETVFITILDTCFKFILVTLRLKIPKSCDLRVPQKLRKTNELTSTNRIYKTNILNVIFLC